MRREFNLKFFRDLIESNAAKLRTGGFSRQRIGGWLCGATPNVNTLARLADLLHVKSFDEFFCANGVSQSGNLHDSEPREPVADSA